MTPDQIANIAGTLILLVSGLAALFSPTFVASLFDLGIGTRGRAEVRINFGAFWTGLAVAALVLNDANVYLLLGAGWGAIVIVRIIAYIIDRPDNMRLYWLLVVGEIITTALLVV